MTNLKISAKMHILIIISSVLIALGIAVGLICEFVADGYFNYGNDYKNYKSVEVTYALVDFPDEEGVEEICKTAFKDTKINYYGCNFGDGKIEYRFAKSVKTEKIQAVAEAINAKLKLDGKDLSNASAHEINTTLGGGKALTLGAIALTAGVAVQFIYFVIRYKLAMALSALLANVHNLGVFLALLSITRIPVGSNIFAFAALTVVATMIGCSFYFDRVRKNIKNEVTAKLGANEICDLSMSESFLSVCVPAVCFAFAAILMFVFLSISALSVTGVLSAVLCAIFSAVACVYGTSFFTPSTYSRFMKIGDDFKAKHHLKKPVKKA
ncbi:MAG: hypothetical protein K2G38_01860 [Clostridia bacterium]|nr:hypothetical protein [Clostridia bacterium]